MKLLARLARTSPLAVLILAACQTSGHDQADSTATNLDSLSGALMALKESLGASASSIEGVVKAAKTDPKPAFERYKSDVSKLESDLATVRSTLAGAQATSQQYFTEWERQIGTIQDEDLRASASKRRAKLVERVGEISKEVGALEAEAKPHVAKMVDLRTYLASDLTPSGIDAIAGKAGDARSDSDSLREDIDDAIETIKESSAEFKTAKPAPPAPAAK